MVVYCNSHPTPKPMMKSAFHVTPLFIILLLSGCGGDGTVDSIDQPRRAAMPTNLRIDLLRGEDVQISSATPRFSWQQSPGSKIRQSAYRIRVAQGNDSTSSSLWDSGTIHSDAAQGVPYGGPALLQDGEYNWRVKIWDASGLESEYSEPQRFRVRTLPGEWPSRLPLVSSLVEPESVVETAPGHIFVSFPATAYGNLILEFPVPHSPGELDVTIGEHRVGTRLWRSEADGFTSEINLTVASAKLFTDGSTGRLRMDLPIQVVPGAAELPDGLADIQPFRYAEISGDSEVLSGIRALQQVVNYSFDEHASHFNSSNPILNDVWNMSKYTMKATSAFGLYIDGNRERLPYEADAYINQLGHYSVDSEYSLARYTNAYLLKNPTWPTEWLLHNHLLAWADYMYTGDDSFLRAHYDELARFTLLPLAREDGLISTRTGLVTPDLKKSMGLTLGPEDIVDWPAMERDDYDMSASYNTVVNLFHWRALDIMSKIATVLGRSADQITYRQRADLVRQSIVDRMLDKTRGILVDGEGSSHASLHANMFALAFDVVPQTYRQTVVNFVKSRDMAASVYGAQYLLEGIYESGEEDYGLSLLTTRGPRGWAHMIYDLGASIAHEAWDPAYKPNEDWNHAWGAAPANIIPRWLMGVRPIDPGFSTFLVAPQPGYLDWAELRFPSIRGEIQVRIDRQNEGGYVLSISVPENSSAYVIPPCSREGLTIRVNGRTTGTSTARPQERLGPFGPGSHEIECG